MPTIAEAKARSHNSTEASPTGGKDLVIWTIATAFLGAR